ncbi:Spondin-1 [Eumeta japonica]|uniref:Spondin-1 n=1 Tax=Eumeta variegata TaxID=151549 RepID=A0A4C1YD21_EUMVA|nr:Spondin-1 [Eumeta japonica]
MCLVAPASFLHLCESVKGPVIEYAACDSFRCCFPSSEWKFRWLTPPSIASFPLDILFLRKGRQRFSASSGVTVIDCTVSAWGPWSGCDAHCGAGSMMRARKVLTPPAHGGRRCPGLAQRRACRQHRACPEHSDRSLRDSLLIPILNPILIPILGFTFDSGPRSSFNSNSGSAFDSNCGSVFDSDPGFTFNSDSRSDFNPDPRSAFDSGPRSSFNSNFGSAFYSDPGSAFDSDSVLDLDSGPETLMTFLGQSMLMGGVDHLLSSISFVHLPLQGKILEERGYKRGAYPPQ